MNNYEVSRNLVDAVVLLCRGTDGEGGAVLAAARRHLCEEIIALRGRNFDAHDLAVCLIEARYEAGRSHEPR